MRNLVKDIASSLTSNVVSAAAQFALQVTLVRMLGIENYGLYVSAVAPVSFIELALLSRSADISMSPLSKLWFSGHYTEARILAARLERQDARWTATIFLGFCVLGLLLAPLLGLDPAVLLLLALSIPAQTGYGVSKSLFIISGAVRGQAKVEILVWGCMFSLCTIGAYLFGVFGVIGGVICTNITKTVTTRIQSRGLIPTRDESTPEAYRADKATVRRQTIQSILRNIFSGATEHTDTLILSAMLGPAAAGTYRLAKSLASLPARTAAPMWIALRPRIARAWAVGERAKRIKVVAWPAAIMMTAMLAAMPLLLMYGDRLVKAVYGREGAAAAAPFLVLLFGTWCYQGATAWYRVTMLMTPKSSTSTYIFAAAWLSVVIIGGAIGSRSPLHMAYVVASTYVVASVLCWVTTFSTRETHAHGLAIATTESQRAGS